jgi:DNA primase
MAIFYSQDILDRVLMSADIVDVISRYIPLSKSGRNFKACCPFHSEKTPSFMVSAEKQIFKCFGCGKGGNVLHFLMEQEHLSFPEAVEMVAEKGGVELPRSQAAPKSGFSKDDLFKAMWFAREFFHDHLTKSESGAAGRNYLKKRGLSTETVAEFKLGYAPEGWDNLILAARKKEIGEKLLAEVGLIIQKDRGGYYDRFRKRVLFPISNVQGRCIGFSGRVLGDGEEPKYLNSPETPLFNKSATLFGLSFSREKILEEKQTIVCEGHLDFLTTYQAGIQNVVAVQGTAFTDQQARLLKRYANKVVFAFDSDSAGEKATLRSFDALVGADLEVKVALMPKGEDPDLVIRQSGPDKFREIIDSAQDLFEFYFDTVTRGKNIALGTEKVDVADELLGFFKKIPNEILKNDYIRRLAHKLALPEETLRLEMKKKRGAYRPLDSSAKKETAQVDFVRRETEETLIKYLLHSRLALQLVSGMVSADDLTQLHCRAVLIKVLEREELSGDLVKILLNGAEDIDQSRLLTECLDWDFEEEKVESAVTELIHNILGPKHKRSKQELLELIKEVGDDQEKEQELLNEFYRLKNLEIQRRK